MKPKEKSKEKEFCQTTVADLQKVFPNTRSTRLKQTAGLINQYDKDFGIDSAVKLQHFLVRAEHESRSVITGVTLSAFKENLNCRWRNLGTKY